MRTYLIWLKLPAPYAGLHCTLMQRLETMATPEEMKPELDVVFERCKPLVLTFYQRSLFGANNDVPVSELVQTIALKELHADVLHTLKMHFRARVLYLDWVLDGYHPHVSDHKDHSFPMGAKTIASQVELIEFIGADKRVRLNWELGT